MTEHVLAYTIIFLGFISLIRLTFLMVSADIYDLLERRQAKRIAKDDRPFRPLISVVIPAYNEELCIVRTVQSVLACDYKHKQVIVVDDGSSDETFDRLSAFKQVSGEEDLIIVRQDNHGKAVAINNALKNHVSGSLVMVLDADSMLHPQAIERMAQHFRDPRVAAMAANVKVIEGRRLLALAQQLEYVISYRMKRALTVLNTEYIIGGVGSTFRMDVVRRCDYYDTDTMTEDIDFTMKIIAREGNRRYKVGFAADVLAYTEPVATFRSLLRQRFRWKYGRMQVFAKHRQIFFSKHAHHGKKLGWVYLPFVVFSECVLLLDPLLITFVCYLSIRYGGVDGLLSAYIAVSLFSIINIAAETQEVRKSKIRLLALSPFSYVLILIMSLVDFCVLVWALWKLPAIFRGGHGSTHGKWEHVERSGKPVSL
jgi:cellulose synthase/poly-beta-1,6-N-acetylglucosamine synthase-like glycosyltransferase